MNVLKGHTGGVTSVSFNHDSTLAISGSEDKTICITNLEDPEQSIPKINAKLALRKALLQGKRPWNRSRLMVVGEGGVGKTSTLRTFFGEPFNEIHDSTIGAKIDRTEFYNESKKKYATKRQAIAKNEEFYRSIAPDNQNDNNSFTLEKNATTHTFRATSTFSTNYNVINDETAVRTSNKNDGGEDIVSKDTSTNGGIKQTHKPISTTVDSRVKNVKETKLNAKNIGTISFNDVERVQKMKQQYKLQNESNEWPITMSVWDYGGQNVFYALHHLFLTREGVYLVVFNMVDFTTILTPGIRRQLVREYGGRCPTKYYEKMQSRCTCFKMHQDGSVQVCNKKLSAARRMLYTLPSLHPE